MIIDIDDRQETTEVDVEQLAALYRGALEALGLERVELSVVLVDEAEMARLNSERMGKDGPTDVLAFPQLELQVEDLASQMERELKRVPADGDLALGDIVLCPSVILAQAPTDPWSSPPEAEDEPSALVGRCPEPPGPESQFHLVAVHGLLHLLGHDHATLEQARAMAEEQERILEVAFEFTLLAEGEGEGGEEGPEDEASQFDEDPTPVRPLEVSLGREAPDSAEAPGMRPSSAVQGEKPDEGEPAAMMSSPEGFRAGYVAIVGRPNVGKSTLMNTLVGEKISITSNKPQTTRNRIVGIYTDARAQVLFIDTPGLHRARDAFNQRLVDAAMASLEDADLICTMIEPPAKVGPDEELLLESLRGVATPKLLLINKVDKIAKERLLPIIEDFTKRGDWSEVIPISALDGTNLAPLMEAIISRLPVGPALYPDDQLTDQTERFIAAETVREKILECARQEVPYAATVVVEGWEEKPDILRIAATIHVERPSQKVILIGRGGEMLKRIGTAARKDLERFFGSKVYLELHVVVSERWREDESFLRSQNL